MRQVMRKKSQWLGDETWWEEGDDSVLQAVGTKHFREYINKKQAMLAEWVALRPIFEVCAKETVYEGGWRLREPWWQQAAAEQQLKSTLKDISVAV